MLFFGFTVTFGVFRQQNVLDYKLKVSGKIHGKLNDYEPNINMLINVGLRVLLYSTTSSDNISAKY